MFRIGEKKFSTSYRINKLPEFLQKMIYYYYLLLLLSVCSHICAHMCECVHGMEMLVPVCVHAEAREGCQVFPSIILHLFFFFFKAGSSH